MNKCFLALEVKKHSKIYQFLHNSLVGSTCGIIDLDVNLIAYYLIKKAPTDF